MMVSSHGVRMALSAADAEFLARLERRQQPQWWALLVHRAATTDSVHGIYDDPLCALIEADQLAADLNANEDGQAELRWVVKLVPYFGGNTGDMQASRS